MEKFKQLIALDVAHRIDNFSQQIKTAALPKPIEINNSDEIFRLESSDRKNADALLISIYTEVSEEHLRALPLLRYIGILGSSTAKIPLNYCQSKNIKVKAVNDYCDYETAEWVIGQIISHFRNCHPAKSVFDKKLGVIGVGNIGGQVLKVATALGMKVYFNARHSHDELIKMGARSAGKEEIFSQCDVISFHTPAHYAWLSDKELRHTKAHALFINSCFGKISLDDCLEKFLHAREDVVMRMDSIAFMSYPIKNQVIIDERPAYDTIDSRNRLINKFFANI
ncbi:MAG: hypothetical protein KC505_08385 [Myxococcales bacterium]|nr:hypothetical protein [Myxococcales bacterium]USN51315.1 MAG: hypothetical protein H6731_02605 [Myxococcales bacterium]